MARRPGDALLFLLLASLWGGSFVAIKVVVTAFPPLFGAFLRVGLALVALGALFAAQGRSVAAPAGVRRRMWLAGLFAQGLPFCLLFWGEQRISPGLAGIINGTVPLFTFCLGWLRGGESVTPRKLAGLLLGFVGIAVICAPMVVFGGTAAELQGTAAVFTMALCYAVGSLMTRSILSGGAKADFRANVFHQTAAAALFLLLVTASAEPWPSWRGLLAARGALIGVVYLGVGSTALAFLIYFHLIREWGAVRAAAVTYVAPAIAVFWDWVFFKNVPPASQWVGIAAILSGVLLLHAAPLRPAAPPSTLS